MIPNSNNQNNNDDDTTKIQQKDQSNIHRNVKKLMVASIFGGFATSLIVTPLDVVKTRLQTQSPTTGNSHQKHIFNGTFDAFKKIYKNEGILTFWRGVTPSLLMTIPNATIYFTSYEYLKEYLYQFNNTEAYNIYTVPLVAGSIARVISASVTSPLELLRTNSQGIVLKQQTAVTGTTTTTINSSSIKPTQQTNVKFNSLNLFKDIIKNVGIIGLWRGLLPTLIRDVPFSAIYWAGYEIAKNKIMKNTQDPNFGRHSTSPFFINFAAGAISGTVAAVTTTPIDVIKTRIQMSAQQHSSAVVNQTLEQQIQFNKQNNSSIYHLKEIISKEGWRGLTKGMVPRVAKVAPACAIMISTFEYIKQSHIADDVV